MGIKGENFYKLCRKLCLAVTKNLEVTSGTFPRCNKIPSGISVAILRVLFLSLRVRVVRFVELLELGVLTVLSVRRVELSELLVLVVRFVERFELQVLVFGTLNYVNFADYEFGAFNS